MPVTPGVRSFGCTLLYPYLAQGLMLGADPRASKTCFATPVICPALSLRMGAKRRLEARAARPMPSAGLWRRT
eukprot:scaffold28990_cov63-Phaeocystis_antarctica.AAC.2